MDAIDTHPLTMNGRDPGLLRGDRIDGERYYSPEFARQEWEHMWKRIWHVAGRENELQKPGDYIVHDFMQESVIVVRQDDGGLRAFYNTCGHRGMRLAWGSAHAGEGLHCPYHGLAVGQGRGAEILRRCRQLSSGKSGWATPARGAAGWTRGVGLFGTPWTRRRPPLPTTSILCRKCIETTPCTPRCACSR